MDNEPLVSVIIPAYNAEKYLDECLESVCNQTYRNLEIIVVNDGSTDNTRKILSRWEQKDSRIRVIDKENGGLSSARNCGINNSRGEEIMFLDSDDTLYHHAIKELHNAKKKFNCRIAVGLITKRAVKLGRGNGRIKEMCGDKLAENILYQTSKVIVSACAQLINRELLQDENQFVEGLYYEDLELIPRLYADESNIAILNRYLYYYRQYDESFIHVFNEHRLDSLKAVASLQRHLGSRSEELRKATDDRLLSASFNVYLLVRGRKGYEDVEKTTLQNIKMLRYKTFINPRVRIKNKIGVVVSFLESINKFLR